MVKPPRAIARFGFVVELVWQESSTKAKAPLNQCGALPSRFL
jgi:hypothetical protein